MISGFGGSFIWVAQGDYLAKCATESSKGFYYGYYWVWYESAQIVGNLCAALVIEKLSGVNFFISMAAFMIVSTFGFCFLRTPKNYDAPRQRIGIIGQHVQSILKGSEQSEK